MKDVANILRQAAVIPDIDKLKTALRNDFDNQNLTAIDLHTGINVQRKAVAVCNKDTIVLAFQGAGPGGVDDEHVGRRQKARSIFTTLPCA